PDGARCLRRSFSLLDCGLLELQSEFRLHRAESLDREFQILARVRGADLCADAGLALRHHGIKEPDDINSPREHGFGEALGECGVPEHERRDRMRARQDVESARRHFRAEEARVFFEAIAQRGWGGESFEYLKW